MTLVLCNKHYTLHGIKYNKQFWSLKITSKHSIPTYTTCRQNYVMYLLFFGSPEFVENLFTRSIVRSGLWKNLSVHFKNKRHKISAFSGLTHLNNFHSEYLIKIGRVVYVKSLYLYKTILAKYMSLWFYAPTHFVHTKNFIHNTYSKIALVNCI